MGFEEFGKKAAMAVGLGAALAGTPQEGKSAEVAENEGNKIEMAQTEQNVVDEKTNTTAFYGGQEQVASKESKLSHAEQRMLIRKYQDDYAKYMASDAYKNRLIGDEGGYSGKHKLTDQQIKITIAVRFAEFYDHDDPYMLVPKGDNFKPNLNNSLKIYRIDPSEVFAVLSSKVSRHNSQYYQHAEGAVLPDHDGFLNTLHQLINNDCFRYGHMAV